MRRMSLAILATVVGVLGATSVASAAGGPVQDGQFNLTFSSGKIIIGGLTTVDIPSGNTVTIQANVDNTGKVSVPKAALVFPPVTVAQPLPLTVGLGLSSRSEGSIDPATGATTVPLNLFVSVDAGALGTCNIPLAISFSTGSASVGSDTLNGSPYNTATGEITMVGSAAIPNPIPIGDCPLAPLLAGILPAGTQAALQLVGTLGMPGGTKYPDDTGTVTPPDPCTQPNPPASCTPAPPPVVLKDPVSTLGSTTLKSTKGSVAVPITCAGTVAANKPCAGKATLTTKVTTVKIKKVKGKKKKITTTKTVTLGSATYSAIAGATATPKIKLSSANQKLLKAAKNKLKATINVTTTGGTGVVNKAVTIKG